MADRLEPVGFWSYTTQDDRISGGHLSQLRVLLANELQLQLGRRHVHIFQDVSAIPHGADWDKAIHGALATSNFMIPIVTPGFLASEWCCKELLKFREREQSLGRDDLIFPFVYIPIGTLDRNRKDDCHDPAAYDLIQARQHFKFSELRFKAPECGEVRRQLSDLARSIVGALRTGRGVPQTPDPLPAAKPDAPIPRDQHSVPTTVRPATDPVPEPPQGPIGEVKPQPAGPEASAVDRPPFNQKRWAAAAGFAVAVAAAIAWNPGPPRPEEPVRQPPILATPKPPADPPKSAETPPRPATSAPADPIQQPKVSATPKPPADPPKSAEVQPAPVPAKAGASADPIQRVVAAIEANMVTIPAGQFRMGSPGREAGPYSDEGPQHDVSVRGFAIGKYDVTFTEWDACVADNGCGGYRPDHNGWGRDDRPVIHVSWDDAQRFVRWLSAKTGKTYRLPSEAEWEYAARATTTTAYYWGADIGKGHANCNGCGSQWDNKQTAPVKSFDPNPWGLYDMAGNVWQWTQDCYHDSYVRSPATGDAWTTGDCNLRVLRGGSWGNLPWFVRAAERDWLDPGNRDNDTGFRVARTLP